MVFARETKEQEGLRAEKHGTGAQRGGWLGRGRQGAVSSSWRVVCVSGSGMDTHSGEVGNGVGASYLRDKYILYPKDKRIYVRISLKTHF